MDIQELRDSFKRLVLPALNGVHDDQVVHRITDLDLRADDLWTELRSAEADAQDLRTRLLTRVQGVYDLMAARPDLRSLLRAVYAYGTYMAHHGQAVSPYVLINAAQVFEQELRVVRLMPSLR